MSQSWQTTLSVAFIVVYQTDIFIHSLNIYFVSYATALCFYTWISISFPLKTVEKSSTWLPISPSLFWTLVKVWSLCPLLFDRIKYLVMQLMKINYLEKKTISPFNIYTYVHKHIFNRNETYKIIFSLHKSIVLDFKYQ